MSSLTYKQVVQAFIIGSSIVVILPFLVGIRVIPGLERIDRETYPIIATFYFGIMNVLALILGSTFGLTLFQRLLLITVISTIFVSILITVRRTYPWTDPKRWLQQYLLIAIGHSLAFLVIIYYLEQLLENSN